MNQVLIVLKQQQFSLIRIFDRCMRSHPNVVENFPFHFSWCENDVNKNE